MVSKKRCALDKLKQDWYVLNSQPQQAQSHRAEERELSHEHSCFTRTSAGNTTSATEFFVAEHALSSVISHPPSGSDITMEDFSFDLYRRSDTELQDYDTVDPAYKFFLKESSVEPKKPLRPAGV